MTVTLTLAEVKTVLRIARPVVPIARADQDPAVSNEITVHSALDNVESGLAKMEAAIAVVEPPIP